jgi:branched-chain amino acid aminotransferase
MNIFFKIDNKLVTAPTNDRILDGVTRKSIIQIAKSKGIDVEERPIKVSEIVEAYQQGLLQEVFGTGTAVVVLSINSFSYRDTTYPLPKENPVATLLKEELVGIQYNKKQDPFHWTVAVH